MWSYNGSFFFYIKNLKSKSMSLSVKKNQWVLGLTTILDPIIIFIILIIIYNLFDKFIYFVIY
jgi:hypothetical protein